MGKILYRLIISKHVLYVSFKDLCELKQRWSHTTKHPPITPPFAFHHINRVKRLSSLSSLFFSLLLHVLFFSYICKSSPLNTDREIRSVCFANCPICLRLDVYWRLRFVSKWFIARETIARNLLRSYARV